MEVIEAEEVGSLLEEVQQAVLDPQRFCRTVKLKGFQPFTTAENALENVNAISEQMVTDDLKVRRPRRGNMYNECSLAKLNYAGLQPALRRLSLVVGCAICSDLIEEERCCSCCTFWGGQSATLSLSSLVRRCWSDVVASWLWVQSVSLVRQLSSNFYI